MRSIFLVFALLFTASANAEVPTNSQFGGFPVTTKHGFTVSQFWTQSPDVRGYFQNTLGKSFEGYARDFITLNSELFEGYEPDARGARFHEGFKYIPIGATVYMPHPPLGYTFGEGTEATLEKLEGGLAIVRPVENGEGVLSRLQNLAAENDNLRSTHGYLEGELTTSQETANQLKQEVAQLKAQLATAKESAAYITSQWAIALGMLSLVAIALAFYVGRKTAHSNHSPEPEGVSPEETRLQSQLSQAREEVERLDDELNDRNARVENLRETVDMLRTQLSEKEEMIEELRFSLNEAYEEISDRYWPFWFPEGMKHANGDKSALLHINHRDDNSLYVDAPCGGSAIKSSNFTKHLFECFECQQKLGVIIDAGDPPVQAVVSS